MKRFLFISLILVLVCPMQSIGQDHHFSQYFASPAHLNPGMTGVFDGNIRVVANYRNQWQPFFPLNTYGVSVDFSTLKHKLKGDMVGVGLSFFNDVAGELDFTALQIGLSGAYAKMLTKRPIQYLTFGAQVGYQQKDFNLGFPLFRPGWDPAGQGDPVLSGGPFRVSFIDLSAGLFWFIKLKNVDLYAGAAIFHVNQPVQNFTSFDDNRLYMKLAFHGGAEIQMNKEWSLLPTYLAMFQGPSKEINIGSYLKHWIYKKENTAVYGGLWYRMVGNPENGLGSDAAIVGIRVDHKAISGALSFDLNISGLREVSHFYGGPEASITLIFPFQTDDKVQYCPRF